MHAHGHEGEIQHKDAMCDVHCWWYSSIDVQKYKLIVEEVYSCPIFHHFGGCVLDTSAMCYLLSEMASGDNADMESIMVVCVLPPLARTRTRKVFAKNLPICH